MSRNFIVLWLGNWFADRSQIWYVGRYPTAQPSEESEAGRRRARARAYPIFELEEFPCPKRGNGKTLTDWVEIWYVGKGAPTQ